ncbi:NAD-dependent dehydratase [Mycetocola miduiensis]|uniref:Uncharacterized protein n=1 Tax=Mycetocola miduiensis TaxID=995034 RepID=A0A1I5CS91_9MICO|nr:NAD-dependent dehydratase [Mycetocola miduiensis]SFN89804.1 hypothetical protein SAMN05216219_2526 [Mycetocola miduiensis]
MSRSSESTPSLRVLKLSTKSEKSRKMWAEQKVGFHRTGVRAFHHPAVGEFELTFQAMHLPGDQSLTLFAYPAEPGTPAADALKLALVTGLKHYLGPFEAYAAGEMPDTPFREEAARLDTPNFYYAQEDELFAAAALQGFTWSVHRSHTVIGHAVGNAMNMGLTIAVQATLAKHLDLPFAFPGSAAQWNGLTDMTDAGVLAEQMVWAATETAGRNEAFNIVNGDVFRWRWMWPRLADLLGVPAEQVIGFEKRARPLEVQMAEHVHHWPAIATEYGLVESDISRLASWWHTDADLGREMEVVTDMGKSRAAGFLSFRRTDQAFAELFDRYRADRLIP